MLSKERFEEDRELISQHLVKVHDGDDGDSLFCRFGELIIECEDHRAMFAFWDSYCGKKIMEKINEKT